jgi:hypothetical protein
MIAPASEKSTATECENDIRHIYDASDPLLEKNVEWTMYCKQKAFIGQIAKIIE